MNQPLMQRASQSGCLLCWALCSNAQDGHTYACTHVQVNHSGTPETSHYGGTARSSEQAAGNARGQNTSAEAQEPEAEEVRAAQPVRASARQKPAEDTAGAMQASLMVGC